jgi:hypothetical protein
MRFFRIRTHTQILVLGAAAITALIASSAQAGFLITNGGFETGELAPWSADGSWDPTGAEVVPGGRLDQFALHLDAGEFEDQYRIFQAVTPTPVSDIVSATLWSMCPTPRWGQPPLIRFHYEDESTSDRLFPLVSDWTMTDATSALTPGAVLTGVELVWYGLGDEGPGSELYLDDVQVQTIPAPGAVVGVSLGLVGANGTRRRCR